MTKSYKKNYSIIRIIGMLCFALVFSCTNITNTDVITHEKKTLAEPTFNYVTGDKVSYGTKIELQYSPNDAFLWYTTDGTEPEQGEDNFYDPHKGIILTEAVTTITVRLYHSNYHPSKVVGHTYNISIDPPVIEAKDGKTTITTLDEISITHGMENADIYYTTDETEPNEDMEEYEKPFTISKTGTVTVKAIAVVGGIKSKAEKVFTVIGADEAYLDTLSVKDKDGNELLTNFVKTQTSYDFRVPNKVNEVNITATSLSSNYDVIIDASNPVSLEPEVEKTVTITVTSETDANKTKTYTVKITRNPPGVLSDDATLSTLKLHSDKGEIALSPVFSSDIIDYEARVEYEVDSAIVYFTTNHSKAKTDISTGTSELLQVGDDNKIEITVIAEDAEATKTYTIKVTRDPIPPPIPVLKSLLVDGEAIDLEMPQPFVKECSKNTAMVVATPAVQGSIVKINGKGTSLEVAVPDTVEIEVTAQDGVTKKIYTLKLEKAAPPQPIPELVSLTVNGETVAISSAMLFRTTKSATAEIVATVKDTASFTINGTAATEKTPVSVIISDDPEKSGNKDVEIILKGEDNSEAKYKLSLIYNYTPPITDKIIIHAESKYKYIHYWGAAKGTKKLESENSSWNIITLDGITSTELLLSSSDITKDDWSGKTGDMKIESAGEYWYKGGKWYEYNPEDTEAPVLTAFTSDQTGTATGDVIFTIAATDNLNLAKIVLTLDGSTQLQPVINVTGLVYNGTYKWNSAAVANGAHTIVAVAEDAGGNVSNEMTINITTNNQNPVPVAAITGASRAKLGSTVTYSSGRSSDLNGTVVGWKWRVSGARILGNDNEANCTIAFPSEEGTATIYLTVTDNDGDNSVEVSQEVTVAAQVSNDFREETIYFLMTTRFYDGDSSNNRYCWDDEIHFKSETLKDPGWRGDFKGLIEKLDYIKALGFSAIWITPVVENASGLDYHGYHAFDFSKVDPRYESADATYQDLIDACHAKGIKVIQDIVLNHTGNFGERTLLPLMKKDYAADDGSHSVPALPDHDAKDIYGNRAYDKLCAGAKLQGFDTYEAIEASSLDASKKGEALYQARLMTMKNDKIDTDEQGKLYHHCGQFQWESYYVQEGQMAGDCVDLNTENPAVAEYIRNCYINYINMGVDGFRIDTMKHISRLTMNREFIPQFKEAGGDDFFMFGEGCVLRNEVWNAGMPGISVPFYTWNANSSKSDASYTWGKNAKDAAANLAMAKTHFDDNTAGVQLTSNNAFLNGNEYRTPDYSKASGLHMIDFYMHHKFKDAGSAFSVADEEDRYFNDATYNVTYVDSHDYGPNEGGYLYTRFSGGTQAWAGNFNLMFTFRGIPCVYYGSEVEFQKDMQIEPFTNGNKVPYARSGRAYFGDHLEGTVTATDFSEYTASGTVADTLNHELAQHVMRLNQIRRAVPALQKGQYSKDGCNGGVAFKRRFVDKEKGIDSFVLVAINGSATFNGVPNGTYVDLVTGDTKSGSTITTGSVGDGNMRVYVLQNETAKAYGATGKVGKDGAFLK